MKKKVLKNYHVNLWGSIYNIKAYSLPQLYLKLFFKQGFGKLTNYNDKLKLYKKIKDEAKVSAVKHEIKNKWYK